MFNNSYVSVRNKYAVADSAGNWLVSAEPLWHYHAENAWLFDNMQEAAPWVDMFPGATLHLMAVELKITELCEVG